MLRDLEACRRYHHIFSCMHFDAVLISSSRIVSPHKTVYKMDGGISGGLDLLGKIVGHCYSRLQSMKSNNRECRVLASFIQRIHELIKTRSKHGLAPHMKSELQELARYIWLRLECLLTNSTDSYLTEFITTVESMSNKSWLRRFWWQDEISQRISLVYRRIQNTLDLLKVNRPLHAM